MLLPFSVAISNLQNDELHYCWPLPFGKGGSVIITTRKTITHSECKQMLKEMGLEVAVGVSGGGRRFPGQTSREREELPSIHSTPPSRGAPHFPSLWNPHLPALLWEGTERVRKSLQISKKLLETYQ